MNYHDESAAMQRVSKRYPQIKMDRVPVKLLGIPTGLYRKVITIPSSVIPGIAIWGALDFLRNKHSWAIIG